MGKKKKVELTPEERLQKALVPREEWPYGVTGRSKWSDAEGLIKKFALREKRYIITLNRDDLQMIYDRKMHLFSLLNEKYLALKNDISFEKLIYPHELESEFR